MWRLLRELSIRSSIPKQTVFASIGCCDGKAMLWQGAGNTAQQSHALHVAQHRFCDLLSYRGIREYWNSHQRPSIIAPKLREPLRPRAGARDSGVRSLLASALRSEHGSLLEQLCTPGTQALHTVRQRLTLLA